MDAEKLMMPVKCHNQLVMASETIKLTVQVSVKEMMEASAGGSSSSSTTADGSLPSDLDCQWSKQDESGATVTIQQSSSIQFQMSSSGSFTLSISGSSKADAGMYTATVAILYYLIVIFVKFLMDFFPKLQVNQNISYFLSFHRSRLPASSLRSAPVRR
jgi:hypothetical protein